MGSSSEAGAARPGQVVMVAGGTGGIGSALCRRLRAGGTTVVLAARSSESLSALGEELGVEWEVMDATRSAEVDAAVAAVVSRHGRLDGLVNCVGSILLKPVHLTTDQDWEETLAKNLTSSFLLLRAAVRAMAPTGGGAVVFCSSVAAQRGLANHEAIAAAKAGVEGLVRSAASTYSRQRIRVNAVAPGLVRTNLSRPITSSEAALKASVALHPLGRIGEPGEIASAIEWLLSPEQGWVTGQVLAVDGGLGRIQPR